jgi:nicotinamidase-related amidase
VSSGWEIVPEVAPIAGEIIVDKPGNGAFYATDLDLLLHRASITHLVFTGITTDVGVHATLRERTTVASLVSFSAIARALSRRLTQFSLLARRRRSASDQSR